jgi:hypothetical protein
MELSVVSVTGESSAFECSDADPGFSEPSMVGGIDPREPGFYIKRLVAELEKLLVEMREPA